MWQVTSQVRPTNGNKCYDDCLKKKNFKVVSFLSCSRAYACFAFKCKWSCSYQWTFHLTKIKKRAYFLTLSRLRDTSKHLITGLSPLTGLPARYYGSVCSVWRRNTNITSRKTMPKYLCHFLAPRYVRSISRGRCGSATCFTSLFWRGKPRQSGAEQTTGSFSYMRSYSVKNKK